MLQGELCTLSHPLIKLLNARSASMHKKRCCQVLSREQRKKRQKNRQPTKTGFTHSTKLIKQIQGHCLLSSWEESFWGEVGWLQEKGSPLGTVPRSAIDSPWQPLPRMFRTPKTQEETLLKSAYFWAVRHSSTLNFNLSCNWNKCLHSANNIGCHLDVRICQNYCIQPTKLVLTEWKQTINTAAKYFAHHPQNGTSGLLHLLRSTPPGFYSC